MVQNLGKGVDEDGEVEAAEADSTPVKAGAQESGDRCPDKNAFLGINKANGQSTDPNGLLKEFGRLKVEGGRSRYVSNKFWVSMSDEVAEMRDILDDTTDEEDDYPSPGSGSTSSANHQGFLFGFSSAIISLRDFHPPPNQIPRYWTAFTENVEPLIKIFHRPTLAKLVAEASRDLDHITKATEATMFAVYFAVITSMTSADCISVFGVEKQGTLEKYRFAVEQSMARAGFLCTQELLILQAFALFLTCVRRSDDSRYVWTMTGLLIRIGQSLGLHRDGQQFGISPFETEMRRRLWWLICTLDVRTSEDHGSDPSIVEHAFDTRFPLNVEDEDLDPDMKEPPVEREGRTEMTFDLIRYTVSTTVRRLSYAPPGRGTCSRKNASLTIEDKERLIEELHQYLENRYLKHCDTSRPLDWVSATVSRLILAKMWLIVHHQSLRDNGGAGLRPEAKNRLFLTSVEVIEFSHLLETEKQTQKWGWLFRTYVQWHAVAFVLSQLCVRASGPDVCRAWTAVDSVFEDWGGAVSASKRGMLWKPLRKLMARARSVRARELDRQSKFPLDGSLGPLVNNPFVTPREPNDVPMMNGNLNPDLNPLPTANPSLNVNFSTYSPPLLAPTSTSQNFQTLSAYPLNPNSSMQNLLPVDAASDMYSPDQARDLNQWGYDETTPPMSVGEGMTWAGFDDLVKDFRMEVEDGQGVERAAGTSGMLNWF